MAFEIAHGRAFLLLCAGCCLPSLFLRVRNEATDPLSTHTEVVRSLNSLRPVQAGFGGTVTTRKPSTQTASNCYHWLAFCRFRQPRAARTWAAHQNSQAYMVSKISLQRSLGFTCKANGIQLLFLHLSRLLWPSFIHQRCPWDWKPASGLHYEVVAAIHPEARLVVYRITCMAKGIAYIHDSCQQRCIWWR